MTLTEVPYIQPKVLQTLLFIWTGCDYVLYFVVHLSKSIEHSSFISQLARYNVILVVN